MAKSKIPKPVWEIDQELFSTSQIAERIRELADEITADYEGQTLNVVPVLSGAMFFSADLIRTIKLHCKVFPVMVNSYIGMKSGQPDVYIPKLWELPENLLIVEDIVDTGNTLDTLSNLLLNAPNVKSVEICSLLHKNLIPPDQISVKYTGFHCPADKFVVGYGLDLDGWFRDLSAIYTLKKAKKNV